MTANEISNLLSQLARMEEKLDNQSAAFSLRFEALTLEVRMLHEKQCTEMDTLHTVHDKDVAYLNAADTGISHRLSKELSDHESRLRSLECRPSGLTARTIWVSLATGVAAIGGLLALLTRLLGI